MIRNRKGYEPDEYDILLDLMGYGHPALPVTEERLNVSLHKVAGLITGLKITRKMRQFDLVLWNDEVHDMIEVALALYEEADLDNDRSMGTMLKAHEQGKAVVNRGDLRELLPVLAGLKKRGLAVTLEMPGDGKEG
jgi:ATP-dependent Clp protease adapter protein ClpS